MRAAEEMEWNNGMLCVYSHGAEKYFVVKVQQNEAERSSVPESESLGNF